MTCALFIKSFSGDFEWLPFALRSIQRFATGFSETVVVVPRGQVPPTGAVEKVFYVEETGDGYLFQQNIKLHADAFTDADFVTYLDSDTIFTRSVSPLDLIIGSKPIWLYTPYASMTGEDARTWEGPTSKLLMRPVENEFMRRHCMTIPRWALIGFKQWVLRTHGMSLERYIAAQPGREFSEFNAIASWMWFHHHDRVEWINTDVELGEPYVFQHHSWSGITDDIRANLEAALS